MRPEHEIWRAAHATDPHVMSGVDEHGVYLRAENSVGESVLNDLRQELSPHRIVR